MDRRSHLLALLFAGANGMYGVAHHLQRLEWNHDLVILDKIAGQQQ
jgi:hypothetical protein